MKIQTATLCQLIEANYTGVQTEFLLQDVSIDSRSQKNTAGVLFFAIQGKFHDAHHFLPELVKRGVTHFVVNYIPKELASNTSLHFFVVKDVLKAFQQLAAYYRSLFPIPIIGITGSNGKTMVKEWLNHLFSEKFNIIKSPKSYNSQVGVPLSVFGINQAHNFGIFEAGISTVEEMKNLQPIITPSFGIFTNIGDAHSEGFLSTEEKIKEKMLLFSQVEKLLIPNQLEIKKFTKNISTISWGATPDSDIFFEEISENLFKVHYQNQSFDISFPFSDKASIYNGKICVACGLYFGLNSEEIIAKIQTLPSENLRLQIKNGKNNSLIIDDSYSSDYQSLKIAFDVLEQQKNHQTKTVILSDILQSGWQDEELYEKIAQIIKNYQVDKVIGIGKRIAKHLPNYCSGVFFDTTAEFLQHYNIESFVDETILIKGSRVFSFEKIVEELEEKTHETVLEVNLDAITHNYNYYKSFLHPTTKMMVMIKAYGYGHGSYEIAKQLQHLQVDYLGVAFADEGVQLRKMGISCPIVVMNPEKSAFSQMIHYQLQPEIYSLNLLESFVKILQKQEISQYPIHLKINTGMNRLGFTTEQIPSLLEYLTTHNEIEISSIFSHLATSDIPKMSDFTLQQIHNFKKDAQLICEKLTYQPLLHILNTSGISNFSEHQLDMVRLGIGLYGVANDADEQAKLESVAKLKTVVLQINEIQSEETVGYGRRFKTEQPTKIATIPIGYADGIRRMYGYGVGKVFIKGKRYPIVGSICMDMLMVNIGKDDINIGDEVEIFGKNISINEVAKKWHTIPYEVMTVISQRVKRVYYKE